MPWRQPSARTMPISLGDAGSSVPVASCRPVRAAGYSPRVRRRLLTGRSAQSGRPVSARTRRRQSDRVRRHVRRHGRQRTPAQGWWAGIAGRPSPMRGLGGQPQSRPHVVGRRIGLAGRVHGAVSASDGGRIHREDATVCVHHSQTGQPGLEFRCTGRGLSATGRTARRGTTGSSSRASRRRASTAITNTAPAANR